MVITHNCPFSLIQRTRGRGMGAPKSSPMDLGVKGNTVTRHQTVLTSWVRLRGTCPPKSGLLPASHSSQSPECAFPGALEPLPHLPLQCARVPAIPPAYPRSLLGSQTLAFQSFSPKRTLRRLLNSGRLASISAWRSSA